MTFRLYLWLHLNRENEFFRNHFAAAPHGPSRFFFLDSLGSLPATLLQPPLLQCRQPFRFAVQDDLVGAVTRHFQQQDVPSSDATVEGFFEKAIRD